MIKKFMGSILSVFSEVIELILVLIGAVAGLILGAAMMVLGILATAAPFVVAGAILLLIAKAMGVF